MGCGPSSLDTPDQAAKEQPASKDQTKPKNPNKNEKEKNNQTKPNGNGKKSNGVEKSDGKSNGGNGGKSPRVAAAAAPSAVVPVPVPVPWSKTVITNDMKFCMLVLGGPGSGKSTLCTKMAEEYDMTRVCMGALIRAEVQKGGEGSSNAAKPMQEGRLVPNDFALNVLKAHLNSLNATSKLRLLIDGFPKTVDQIAAFDAQFTPDVIIYLACPSDKLEERLLTRAESGERADDKSEAIVKRIELFNREYSSVVDYFTAKYPQQFKKVKSGSLEKVEVFLEVASHLKEMFSMLPLTVLGHKKHDCSKLEYVFILGGPGSGKGTQCKQMVREFGYTHVSTGDLLRNEVKAGSTIGREVDAVMRSGGLVPLSVTLTLVDNAFRASSCKHFLIDGFPRSLEQAHAFEKKFGKPALVIYLNCSTSTMEKRLLDRGKTSNRADDNIKTIKLRFETFQKESKPVIEYYKSKNSSSIIKEISAEKDPAYVFKIIKETIETLP